MTRRPLPPAHHLIAPDQEGRPGIQIANAVWMMDGDQRDSLAASCPQWQGINLELAWSSQIPSTPSNTVDNSFRTGNPESRWARTPDCLALSERRRTLPHGKGRSAGGVGFTAGGDPVDLLPPLLLLGVVRTNRR